MKTISIPADTEHLYLDEVAHLISECRNPEGANDPEGVRYELDKIQAEHEAHQAARDGLLRVRHPGTLGPFPIELGLERAVVLLQDAVAYLAEYGVQVVVAVEKDQQSQQPSGKRWTETFTNEVRAYRSGHTEKETAARYGVSGALIRAKLAPPKKAKAQPFDGMGRRAK